MQIKKARYKIGLSLLEQIKLLVHYVHGYFKTETHFSCLRLCPHSISPFLWLIKYIKHKADR